MSDPAAPSGDAPHLSVCTDPALRLLEGGLLRAPARPGLLACLDRYEVLSTIGAGGMGIVLLARDPQTGGRVAVKMIRPEFALDPRMLHRFTTEARHISKLDHPHIVRVLALPEDGAAAYFVLPFMEGGSLAARISPAKPLDGGVVLCIALDIAGALDYAHVRGITHRDLKPSNVLLDEQGRAYLADFGLGRTVFNDSIVDPRHSSTEGTPAYMAPELAGGGAGDTRCDTYAFGALLYEMLTGSPPFDGGSTAQILQKVLVGPPPPILERNPEANPGLAAIAEGAMARELRDRYASMGDVVADLERVFRGERPHGPRGHRLSPRRPVAKLLFVAAVVVLAACLAIGHLLWRRGGRALASGGPTRTSLIDDAFDGRQLNDGIWTLGNRKFISRANAPGESRFKIEPRDGALHMFAEAQHDNGPTVVQALWVHSKLDFARCGDALVDLRFDLTGLHGQAVLSLSEGYEPGEHDVEDIKSIRLFEANAAREPAEHALQIRISSSSKLAIVQGRDGVRLVDISRLSYWYLKLCVTATSCQDFGPGRVELNLQPVRARLAPAGCAVAGRITDAASGRGLSEASIRCIEHGESTTARLDGWYYLPAQPGECRLRISAPVYPEGALKVAVGADHLARGDLALTRDPAKPGSVVASYTFDALHQGVYGLLISDHRVYYTTCNELATKPRAILASLDADLQTRRELVELFEAKHPYYNERVPLPGNGLVDCDGIWYGVDAWPGRLFRIDPQSGASPDRPLGVAWARGLAFDGKRLWFLEIDKPHTRYALHAINPRSLEQLKRYALDDVQMSGLTWGDGALWVSTLKGWVYRVDPTRIQHGQLVEGITLKFPGYYEVLSFGDGHLWGVDNQARRICKISIGSPSASATVRAPATVPSPAAF